RTGTVESDSETAEISLPLFIDKRNNMTGKSFQMLALLVLLPGAAGAQADGKNGYLTGSFETNTIYYKNDSKADSKSPEDHFGSNNYLKLDYYRGKFAAGVQLEAYEPVLAGYPAELEKAKLT